MNRRYFLGAFASLLIGAALPLRALRYDLPGIGTETIGLFQAICDHFSNTNQNPKPLVIYLRYSKGLCGWFIYTMSVHPDEHQLLRESCKNISKYTVTEELGDHGSLEELGHGKPQLVIRGTE